MGSLVGGDFELWVVAGGPLGAGGVVGVVAAPEALEGAGYVCCPAAETVFALVDFEVAHFGLLLFSVMVPESSDGWSYGMGLGWGQ